MNKKEIIDYVNSKLIIFYNSKEEVDQWWDTPNSHISNYYDKLKPNEVIESNPKMVYNWIKTVLGDN